MVVFFRLLPELSRPKALRKIEGRCLRMSADIKKELPWWQKYTLTLNEASEYLGIGYKKLKLFVQQHPEEDFVLWNGNRALIKREQFEKYMDSQMPELKK
jgi:hypothetical protein